MKIPKPACGPFLTKKIFCPLFLEIFRLSDCGNFKKLASRRYGSIFLMGSGLPFDSIQLSEKPYLV